MTDLELIRSLRRYNPNPTIGDLMEIMRMIRDGDLIHVNELADRPVSPAVDLRDWLMKQDREYRLTILNDLSDAEAEAQHDDRQRDGYPATDYAAECIRQAGRGHLLIGGA